MIPRKRLQVLLYILQIFYVFGDGDPGSDGLLEIPNNVIDDPIYTTKSPHMHVIQQMITSTEDSRAASKELYTSGYEFTDNESLNSEESFTETVNITEGSNATESNNFSTTIEEVKIDDNQGTFVNISWVISGKNASQYLVDLYSSGNWVQNYTTIDTNMSLMNLTGCTNYEIGVAPLENEVKFEMKFVNITTSLLKPEQVENLTITNTNSGSIEIKWLPPKIGYTCINHYRIVYNNEDDKNSHNGINFTEDTSFNLENLHACTYYYITVVPIDIENKDGSSVRERASQTLQKVVNAPTFNITDDKSVMVSENSSTIIWKIEDKLNNCSMTAVRSECQFVRQLGTGYELTNGTGKVDIINSDRPKNVTITINGLSPYTIYQCRARVEHGFGNSSWSEVVNVTTNEAAPNQPQNFRNAGKNDGKRIFQWKSPDYKPGKIIEYKINFTWTPRYPVPDECNVERTFIAIVEATNDSNYEYHLFYEEPLTNYVVTVQARSGGGWSPESPVEFPADLEGLPGPVTNLNCTIKPSEENPNVLDTILSWGLPCLQRGYISEFYVSFVGTRPDHDLHNFSVTVPAWDGIQGNDKISINFGELKPLYTYIFEVSPAIHGSIELGNPSNLIETYPAGIPPTPDLDYVTSITLDPHKARRTTTSAAILLPLFSNENGVIKYYSIIVSGVPFDNSSTETRLTVESEWPDIPSWEEAMEKDFQILYQAVEPRWNPFPNYVVDYGHLKAVKLVIGEDTTCPEVSSKTKVRVYCNGPLKPDTWYEVRMRAFTDHGYSDSVSFTIKTNAELNIGLVLGVVFGILFLGILTTLMLLVKRCSFRLLVQRILQSNIPESPVPNPFTRRKFINHCQKLADNPAKLSNEFQLLQTLSIDLQMPSNAACLQANRKKNRYSDILPYDFSRVKLEVIDNDPNTDYINASFIRGYSGNEEYIACQGPKEDTTYDFWRMIDQYDIKMIVMLTQLVERGKEKCHQYFPTIRETFNYEKFSVRCTSELDYRAYTHRTLVLQKENQRRTITHLHFKDWPDHDVPDDFEAMIHFCQMFRKQMNTLKGISVIHCSAGIGRTGTLIAIDILLQSIRDNRKIDVFGTVYRLRRHRLNMVQRESQYAYIYNCIRQVLKNPYFLKTYKPPPIDPIYVKDKTLKDKTESNTDLVDSFDTLRKNSLSTSADSMHPLCQSSPQATPKIQMNGLRYCKSTSAIDTRSNHNRMGRYNSEGYAICESAKDSFSTTSKESVDENDLKSSSSSLYENVEPLIRPSSSQTIAGSNYHLTNESGEKDTSL